MFDDHEKVAKASSIHSTKEGASDEDDDRKFNREQQIEISFTRADLKERRRKEEEHKQLELEKAEKKKAAAKK